MRLVFLGSGAFGGPTLEWLAREHDVLRVVTQPDRPAGRGGKLRPTPIGELAERLGLEVTKPDRVNVPEAAEPLRAMGADAWVVIAYGQKLSAELLDGVFAMNLHASLLPRWRGAAPIHHAIMAGDRETGNSVITLADRMDAGDVLASTTREVEPSQTTGDLHDLLAGDGPGAIAAVLADLARGGVTRREQDDSLVTLAPKLSRADAVVDWSEHADRCRCRINGLSPWPGCAATIGGVSLKLLRAAPAQGEGAPGEVLDVDRGVVACGQGAVRLLEVQPEGKRGMAFAEFARGREIAAGSRLEQARVR